jgi:hypothetical protein
MPTIPDAYLDLFQQKKAFANLATMMPDGTPQVTPVRLQWQRDPREQRQRPHQDPQHATGFAGRAIHHGS